MTNEEQEAIAKIAEAAELLGWQIAFPNHDAEIDYIVIAKPDVIDKITARLED